MEKLLADIVLVLRSQQEQIDHLRQLVATPNEGPLPPSERFAQLAEKSEMARRTLDALAHATS